MELISYLAADHKNIRRLIREIAQANQSELCRVIFQELLEVFTAHFKAVEVAVYTTSIKKRLSEMTGVAVKGFEEHSSLDELVYRMRFAICPEIWMQQLLDFCQALEAHIMREETEYFPLITKNFNAVEFDRAAVLYLKIKKSEYTRSQQTKKYKKDKEIQLAN